MMPSSKEVRHIVSRYGVDATIAKAFLKLSEIKQHEVLQNHFDWLLENGQPALNSPLASGMFRDLVKAQMSRSKRDLGDLFKSLKDIRYEKPPSERRVGRDVGDCEDEFCEERRAPHVILVNPNLKPPRWVR